MGLDISAHPHRHQPSPSMAHHHQQQHSSQEGSCSLLLLKLSLCLLLSSWSMRPVSAFVVPAASVAGSAAHRGAEPRRSSSTSAQAPSSNHQRSSSPSWLPGTFTVPGTKFDKRFRMPSQFGAILSEQATKEYLDKYCAPSRGARSRLPPVHDMPGVRLDGATASHTVGTKRHGREHLSTLVPFVKERREAPRRAEARDYPEDGKGTATLLEGLDLSTCAVVGNAGALKLTRAGPAIDKHGTVFRMNQAPTRTYERWVGRKTSIRLINRMWTKGYASGVVGMRHSQLPTEDGVRFVASREFPEEFAALARRQQRRASGVFSMSFQIVNKARRALLTYRECLRRTGAPPSPGGNTPSSGFVAAFYFKEVCDHLNIYGIGTPRNAPPESTYQYYRGFASRPTGNPTHSFETEERLLRAMANARMLSFCTFDGCFPDVHRRHQANLTMHDTYKGPTKR